MALTFDSKKHTFEKSQEGSRGEQESVSELMNYLISNSNFHCEIT